MSNNNWASILKKINDFFSIQRSISEIDDYLKTQKFPNPIEGIDLKGFDKSKLLERFKNNKDEGARAEIAKGKNTAEKWKQYEPLNTPGDGNCFFNAFSILLVGDISLATQLRIACCLGIMSRQLTGTQASKNPDEILKEINGKLPDMSSSSNYQAWRYLDDIAYMSEILKRPIRLVYRPDISAWEKNWPAYKDIEANGGISQLEFITSEKDSERVNYVYSDWFTIYHVAGNHFVPLVPAEKVHKPKIEFPPTPPITPPPSLSIDSQESNNKEKDESEAEDQQASIILAKQIQLALKEIVDLLQENPQVREQDLGVEFQNYQEKIRKLSNSEQIKQFVQKMKESVEKNNQLIEDRNELIKEKPKEERQNNRKFLWISVSLASAIILPAIIYFINQKKKSLAKTDSNKI